MACRSGVSAVALEVFVNNAGSVEDHATVPGLLGVGQHGGAQEPTQTFIAQAGATMKPAFALVLPAPASLP